MISHKYLVLTSDSLEESSMQTNTKVHRYKPGNLKYVYLPSTESFPKKNRFQNITPALAIKMDLKSVKIPNVLKAKV